MSQPIGNWIFREIGSGRGFQIECVARSRATVFITGESGTGKDVCAETIHRESGRAKGPFIAINCGAIPENFLESELFGHIEGSFTGAISDRIGAVQAANKGTLFLDEICEMELSLRVKLLRLPIGNWITDRKLDFQGDRIREEGGAGVSLGLLILTIEGRRGG